MTIVLGDGTYNDDEKQGDDLTHGQNFQNILVIDKIQRSFIAAVLSNDLPEDRAVVQSGTLIVTDASKFSLLTMPTRQLGVLQRRPGDDCSTSSRIGTTGSGMRMLKTRFMRNDQCSWPSVPPTSMCTAIYSNT